MLHLAVAVVFLTTAHSSTSISRSALVLNYRGGADATGLDEEPALPSAAACLRTYVEELNTFMDLFEALLEKASRTSKKSRFLGLTASAATVAQRGDRRALHTAHQQLREVYRDAVSLSEREDRQHLFAAATLRLHVLLQILLRAPAPPDVAASAGVGTLAEHPPPTELVPPEELEALYALRGEMVRKPQGTISEVLAELRTALEALANAHLSMLYACLRAAATALPTTTKGLPEGGMDMPQDGTSWPSHATAGADMGELEREVAMALEQAEAAQAAAQQQQAETERVVAEHGAARAAAEAAAADALKRLAAAEAAAAEAQQQHGQQAATRAADQGQMAEKLSAANAQLDEALRMRDESTAAAAEHGEKLRLASQAAAQAQAAEAVARSHAAHLAQQLSGLEAQHSQLTSAHKALEHQTAQHALLEQQIAHRIEALSQLGREIPDGPTAPAVPLTQHRELQMELQSLQQRHAELQRAHAGSVHALGQARAEAQGAGGYVRELTRRLEVAEAKLQAANAFQPMAPPVSMPTGEADAASDGAAAAAALVSSSAEAAKAVGGTLLASLNKGMQQAKALSKGFLDDFAGLQGGGADEAVPPRVPEPQDDEAAGRRIV